MFNVFKETWVGLRDLNYGSQIIKFSWKKVYKHWFSAFVWVFVVWTLGAIAFWTYFAPQIPKVIMDTSLAKPMVVGDTKNVLMIDNNATASALSSYKAALLVGKENFWYKVDDKTGQISKTSVLAFIKDNKAKVWFLGTTFVIVITIFMVFSLCFSQILGILFWSIIFRLGGKILSKKLNYVETLKICAYASVPGIFINGFSLRSMGMLGTILPLVLFAWYSGMWIYKLPNNK